MGLLNVPGLDGWLAANQEQRANTANNLNMVQGLLTMQAGGTYMLVFPGQLGYGPGGNPGAGIPPNATLVFEVELISIE